VQRAAAAVVVLLIVFGAGVLTGRALFGDGQTTSAVDPDAAAVALGSQRRPIPLARSADVGAWSLRIDDVALDGTEEVLAANQFNTPPDGDDTFVLVDLTVRRRAAGPAVLRGSVTVRLATPAGRQYPLTTDCGVLPRPLDVQQPVGEGQEVDGQLCWVVPVHDLAKVALRIGSDAVDGVWFALG
jgi:hypothetical protein